MGIHPIEGRWYLVKRVPVRFAEFDPRGLVRISLRTDSAREAKKKAPAVEAELLAFWEALAAGDTPGAKSRHAAAVKLASARGLVYRPAPDLAAGDLAALVERIEFLMKGGALASPVEGEAVLGGVAAPRPLLSEMLEDFFELTRDRLPGKSAGQVKRWQDVRRKTIANMIEVFGDKRINEIIRDDALAFRKWWLTKVEAGHAPNTANKQFGQASDIFTTVSELRSLGLANPFLKLRLKDDGHSKREPFSDDWIRDHLLADGALDRLNEAARDVLIGMVNTGCGPNEIIGAEPEDYRLDDPIPHIVIRPNGVRGLKTSERPREVPLLGVSLDSARRLAAAGGCREYWGRNDTWSATVNKFLRSNGLFETENQTAYSLRHSFEDRLLDAGVDDRIRADLMGHAYARPKYGKGGRLPRVRDEIAKIAL